RPNDVESILSPVRLTLQSKARANKVQLVERVEPNLPEVFADAEKASRVLLNLASHAIRLSPEDCQVNISEIAVTYQGAGMTAQSNASDLGLEIRVARELAALNLGAIEI